MPKKPDKKRHSDIRVPEEDIRVDKNTDGFKKTLEKTIKRDKDNKNE